MPTALAHVPLRKIVRAIADAAERWSDGDFPPRVRVLDAIAARTGYSLPVVEYALDRLFFSLTQAALEDAIRGELGSLEVLDGFVDRPDAPSTFASPVGSVCIVSSRTTIGVAILPAVFALCAKCDVVVKDREDLLVSAFFETLREELDEFGTAAHAQSWSSGDEGAPSFSAFDAVVAFGSNDALDAIAARCGARTQFTGYGARASAGYVTRESIGDPERAKTIARGAARDLVLYESEGCLSLHVLFVEGEPDDEACAAFLQKLAAALDEAAIEFPAGTLDAAKSAQTSQAHRLAAFRAAGGRGAVYGTPGAHALVVEPPESEPPAFLPRTLGVHFVASPQQASAYLRAHALPLEAFALSEARPDTVAMAVSAGAVRLTRFGELQHPPAAGHHGGRPRIAGFIRWIDKDF
ncbi:MAG TPA: acyl-CoA reductase [Candidatus Baltobacteraceae bacterium]|nr:acyl-CoA reductase [Candidatus Baltobacteraceae bacterium]